MCEGATERTERVRDSWLDLFPNACFVRYLFFLASLLSVPPNHTPANIATNL